MGIAKGLANVRLTGLHCHIGSQVFEMEPFVDAVDIIMDFARQAHEATGFVMEELNIGGGLGIRYNSKDDPITARDLAEAVAPALIDAASRYGLPLPVTAAGAGEVDRWRGRHYTIHGERGQAY